MLFLLAQRKINSMPLNCIPLHPNLFFSVQQQELYKAGNLIQTNRTDFEVSYNTDDIVYKHKLFIDWYL